MNNRIWDMEGKYKEGFLKEYDQWILELSFRQHTLFSYIIFSKRNIEKISELNENELKELKEVMLEIETTLTNWKDVKPDRFNYLQLGNSLNHLHFHGIPRYKDKRIFNKTTWSDNNWGSVPEWSNNDVAVDIIKDLKIELLKRLP